MFILPEWYKLSWWSNEKATYIKEKEDIPEKSKKKEEEKIRKTKFSI